ncbi:MAG: FG-GAP-like repeat-containing protein [Myxococcota bacterium]
MSPKAASSTPAARAGRSRTRPRRCACLRRAAAIALLASLAVAGPETRAADEDDDPPFRVHRHAIRGRIVQVWSLAVGPCTGAAVDLLVLSSEGGPPDERRFATLMPCGAALQPGSAAIRVRALPSAAVFVDVARVPGRRGPQLLSVSAAGLRIEALDGPADPVEIAVPGGLALPPRPWAIARLPLVERWNGDARVGALVPAPFGAWLVDLDGEPPRRIEMPMYADYQTWQPDLPETFSKWMTQEIHWPTLARADDDGDGRLDLFALSRWSIGIYRLGPKGLPSTPSRRLAFVPFDEAAERRHGASVHSYAARDLDGDGRADLVLNTIEGGLMKGHSTTRIHLGRGRGVSLEGPPDVLRESRGGLAGVDFIDLEGDGRLELLETDVEFGVLQLVRLLVTRRLETTVRILALDPDRPEGVRTLFEDRMALALDFEAGRLAGIVPGLGDWNGDGRLDLLVPRGERAIGFRMGRPESGSARFGSVAGEQRVPLATASTRAVDVDADGLDDIVLFTTAEPGVPLVVLENRGRLPGSPSSVRPR